MRGNRYYTPDAYQARQSSGRLEVLKRSCGRRQRPQGTRPQHAIVQSDASLVRDVLGPGSKQNVLVINDEAHHAYRIPPKADDDQDDFDLEEDEKEQEQADEKEATVWIDGLDKINKVRGINLCVDLSATPYYLGRMGNATNTVFPWVVSDFGLTDAIEAGMVKVPQLVARGPTGQKLKSYFNIWSWILPKLTAGERGSKRGSPKAEAILKHAHTPIAVLGGMWAELLADWRKQADPRPPVFILVAKNKKIAKALYEWIGEDVRPPGIPSLNIPELRNTDGNQVTIRVDTGVVQETDSGNAKFDESGMDALHAGHSGAADLARGQTRAGRSTRTDLRRWRRS